jgi:homoserine/homoserine lactone efflux protein
MNADQWITYCLAVFAGGIIPGPIMLLAMTAGAKKGVVTALPAAMGNVFASIVQVLASIAVVSAVVRNVESLLRLMMALGGVYLIYLGVSLFKANPFKLPSGDGDSRSGSGSHLKDFVDVFFVTLLNPKAILFFVALFPQVIPRDHYSVFLVFAMTTAFAFIALLCFVIYAFFGAAIGKLAKGAVADIVNCTLAIFFVVFGFLAVFNATLGG